MKTLTIILISLCYTFNLAAQECKEAFESNYFNLTICNDSGWLIEQSLPYIKIKTNNVKTFITFYSEPVLENETLDEAFEKSILSDKKSFGDITIIKKEKLKIDTDSGIFYISKVANKETQITTFIFSINGQKVTINNNCYTNCSQAEITVRSIIQNIKFHKKTELGLSEKEIKDFEEFKTKFHTSFQKSDIKLFEELQVNQPLMLELINTKLKDETMKTRFSNIINNNWNEFSKEFVLKSKLSFEQLMAKGKELGINWNNIVFDSMNYNLESSIPGIISMKCNYRFSYANKKYEIIIDSVEPLKNGCFISKLENSNIQELK